MAFWQYRHREKSVSKVEPIGFYHDWYVVGSPASAPYMGTLYSEQSEVYDENHGRLFYKNPGVDDGGNFDLYRSRVIHRAATADIYRPNGTPSERKGLAYSGAIPCSEPVTPDISDAQYWANLQMPKLWNKARPAQPNFEGLNAFYELRELPGMLKQRFTGDLLSTGANLHLAYQFGWAPLLRDVRDFYVAHLALKNSIENLIRDEGKQVRRRVQLPEVSYTTDEHVWSGYGAFALPLVTQCYAGVPVASEYFKFTRKCWFSGAFRYWLPGGNRLDWRWHANIVARLYGLNPTPYRIYKAIPWSWLVDWFSNIGPVIQANSSLVEERLAADYAYVMCSIVAERVRTAIGRFHTSNDWDQSTELVSSVRVVREHLTRVPAGVFGPMVGGNDLSPTQLGILGALAVK